MSKSSERVSISILIPQPTKDEEGMWYWEDCQWMDGGLGFPKSEIEDHFQNRVGKAFIFHDETYGVMECSIDSVDVKQLKDLSDEDKERVYWSGLADGYTEDVWLLLCHSSVENSKILPDHNFVADKVSCLSDMDLLSLFKDICASRHTGIAMSGSMLRKFHCTLREFFGSSANVISLAESEILFEISRRWRNEHLTDRDESPVQ